MNDELNVFEAMPIEMGAQKSNDVLRILIRHEAEIDLDHTLRRQNRLGALARIAPREAIHIHARLEIDSTIEVGDVDPVEKPLRPRRLQQTVEGIRRGRGKLPVTR